MHTQHARNAAPYLLLPSLLNDLQKQTDLDMVEIG
jgi:hypothetical protein